MEVGGGSAHHYERAGRFETRRLGFVMQGDAVYYCVACVLLVCCHGRCIDSMRRKDGEAKYKR